MQFSKRIGELTAVFVVAAFVFGCGNYTNTTRQSRDEFYAGHYSEAAKLLEQSSKEEGVDQLLFLMDRATALHHAQDFGESIKDFQLADKLSEIKDYTSISTEAATLVTNDKIVAYKGEDFEKVLISQYLALNYLMLRKYEDALVECRRVNHKLHMMISVGKRKYKLNPMASYLAALMYEDSREWNDAYVDYQAVYKLVPEFQYLREDLYRLAWRNGIREHMEKWEKEFNLSADDTKRIRDTANQPELIVIVENGKAPEKHPNPQWDALPQYVPVWNPVSYAKISVDGVDQGRSEILYNVEKTAIENLDEKYAMMLAKKLAGVVVKEVIADQADKKIDPWVGALMRIGMHALNQADLRSWLTLPKDFQIFRIKVKDPKKSYEISVYPKSADGSDVSGTSGVISKVVQFPTVKPNVKVSPKAFVIVRTW